MADPGHMQVAQKEKPCQALENHSSSVGMAKSSRKEPPAMSLEAAIALNRFGLGARPGDLANLSQGDPRAYLKAQLANPRAALITDTDLLGSSAAFTLYTEGLAQRRAERANQASQRSADRNQGAQMAAPDTMSETMSDTTMSGPGDGNRRRGRADADGDVTQPMAQTLTQTLAQRAQRLLGTEIAARVRHGATTDASFLERWVLFWSNHFTMAASGAQKVPFAGPFEREAIRPHVLGRFVDLLVASTTHPGMLVYLDQAQSIGPNSPAGSRAGRNGRVRGLNENLAREVLELHTLGAQGGYTQADVTEFARAFHPHW
jgi:uncharacterized protein (DUF1800 family)